MLTNSKIVGFAQQVAADAELRAALEVDFEGTLKAHGLELGQAETESLKASVRYLKGINPMALEARIAAGGGTKSGC